MFKKKNNSLTPLNFHTSYVVNDPNGIMLAAYGNVFLYMGYNIKSLNLKDTLRSNQYNPLAYIRTDADILMFSDEFICDGNQEFLDGEKALLCIALTKSKTVNDVIEYIEKGDFKDLSDFAKKQLVIFNQFSAGAKGRIKASLLTRFRAFSLTHISGLTKNNDIGLDSFYKEKTVLFIKSYESNKLYDSLVNILKYQINKEKNRYLEELSDESTLVADRNDVPIKVFTPDEYESPKFDAKEYLSKIQNAYVADKPAANIHAVTADSNKRNETELKLWSIRMANGELVAVRGSQKEAKAALKAMKKGVAGKIAGLPFDVVFAENGFSEPSSVRRLRNKMPKYAFPLANASESNAKEAVKVYEPEKNTPEYKEDKKKENKSVKSSRPVKSTIKEPAEKALNLEDFGKAGDDTAQILSKRIAKLFDKPKETYKKIENTKTSQRFDEYVKEIKKPTSIDIFELKIEDLEDFA